MRFSKVEGERLAKPEFGGGPAAIAGDGRGGRTARGAAGASRGLFLLLCRLPPQGMHKPLAEDLAARGNLVITLDLLGHGHSDRPLEMWRYSMATYGRQIGALMAHRGLDEAGRVGT